MKTIQDIEKDENLNSSLILPKEKINLYTIYQGTDKLIYYMFLDGKLLFHGNDFRPSPMHNIDDLETIISLLDFLTISPGDTDHEYFKDYTSEQLEYAESSDCEQLSLLIGDLQDIHEDFYNDAFEYFNSNYQSY